MFSAPNLFVTGVSRTYWFNSQKLQEAL